MPRGSSPAFSSYPWPDLPISCPAYAPTTKSPARYRAGRAKQHNHARNVKPFPPSEESGENPPRAGGGRAVPAASSGQSFCAAHSTMPRGSSPAFSSYPWPDLPISCPAYAPTTKSPARYRAGRAKQHNHARNVTPSPLGGVRGGQCPLPCPAQEACVAGESTPGLFLDFPPSPRAGGGRAVPAALSGPGGLHCRRQCPGERPYTSAPLGRWAVPAAMSGPGGLHCRRQCPGERPYTSAPLCH